MDLYLKLWSDGSVYVLSLPKTVSPLSPEQYDFLCYAEKDLCQTGPLTDVSLYFTSEIIIYSYYYLCLFKIVEVVYGPSSDKFTSTLKSLVTSVFFNF